MDDQKHYLERRAYGPANLVHRFTLKYPELLSFLAGWSAYPIGIALLSLLGR
jgi:hypothetical protein